jgi:alkanesulfonate monooxygenase SsuD/methylene tetrahydromethanopterin reductase-like flavin-dependent oxidoreductase (luciferase family)
MDVSVGTTARRNPDDPRPLTDVYDEVIEEAVLAEELGFASFLLAEHHFAQDAHNPSALPLLAAVAARTERIRLGPYVLLLALHHPIRIAEDAAMLDIISHGRLLLGIGGGPMDSECEVFGIDRSETFNRTYEALDIIHRCFTEDEFTHDGRYFHFAGVRMTTKPVQPGGPPIYMAARGPQSLARAGRRGYHLGSALHAPRVEIYDQAQAEAGRSRSDYRKMTGPIPVHIAPTREQAWDEAERALHWWISFYHAHHRAPPPPPLGELRATPGIGLFGLPFAVGTVDDVLAALMAHQSADLDELVIAFNHPGMDAAAVRRSMTTFADELMPAIRLWSTPAA